MIDLGIGRGVLVGSEPPTARCLEVDLLLEDHRVAAEQLPGLLGQSTGQQRPQLGVVVEEVLGPGQHCGTVDLLEVVQAPVAPAGDLRDPPPDIGHLGLGEGTTHHHEAVTPEGVELGGGERFGDGTSEPDGGR